MLFSGLKLKLMSLALLAVFTAAEPLPLEARELIPSWECPGPKEGRQPFDIATRDWQALATAIHTNTLDSGPLDDQILIKARHGIAIKAGSVQICVENQYLFDNAHYSRTDIALAVAQGMYNCCGGDNVKEICNYHPWLTIKGDTGLKAIATIGAAGDNCNGAPGKEQYLSAGQIAFKTGKLFWDIFKPLLTGRP